MVASNTALRDTVLVLVVFAGVDWPIDHRLASATQYVCSMQQVSVAKTVPCCNRLRGVDMAIGLYLALALALGHALGLDLALGHVLGHVLGLLLHALDRGRVHRKNGGTHKAEASCASNLLVHHLRCTSLALLNRVAKSRMELVMSIDTVAHWAAGIGASPGLVEVLEGQMILQSSGMAAVPNLDVAITTPMTTMTGWRMTTMTSQAWVDMELHMLAVAAIVVVVVVVDWHTSAVARIVVVVVRVVVDWHTSVVVGMGMAALGIDVASAVRE
jgi:hypothetical protein